MSNGHGGRHTARTDVEPPGPVSADDPTLGALVLELSEQTSALVRSEVELAKAELAAKGKTAGIGAGLFGTAGLLGFYGAAVLIATAILALALWLPAWAAALIVGVVLLAAAGVAAMLGRNKVAEATPAKPERTFENVREDVETLKGGHHE
jgi:uncharacterized small protein (DUF1192 family)